MSRCPEGRGCIWCGSKAGADHRHARQCPLDDMPPFYAEGKPSLQDVEYDRREAEYEAWLEERVLKQCSTHELYGCPLCDIEVPS